MNKGLSHIDVLLEDFTPQEQEEIKAEVDRLMKEADVKHKKRLSVLCART